MNRGRSYITSVGLTAVGLSLIAPAVAQEVGGLTASFGIRQSLQASDNFDLADPESSGTRSETELSFGLSSVTDNSRLDFNTSGFLEFGTDDDAENGFNNPSASLSYVTMSRNSRLALSARYSEADVETLSGDFADTNGFGFDQLVTGDGTRLSSNVSLDFETGLDAPLGFILNARYARRDFRDVANDPDLFETETLTYGATARLRVNPAVTMRFGFQAIDYDAQDDDDTRRDDVDIFWETDFAIRSDLMATTRLSFDRNETRTATTNFFGVSSGNDLDVDEGFGGGFTITKTLQNGTIGADFDSRVTSDGRRDTVRLTRAIELPRGDFSLSVGAVATDSSDVEPLVDVSYRQETQRGLMTLGLSQQASIDDDTDTTIINTRLRAAYDQEINSSSSWGISAALADSDGLDTGDDSLRLDLGVNYRREVTRDWDLVANYTYSSSEQSGESDRTSNTVSLSIERGFLFRP